MTTSPGRWHRAAEVLLAVALFLYDSMYLVVQHAVTAVLGRSELILAETVSAGLCAMLLLRRRAPVVTAASSLVMACVYPVLGVGLSPAPVLTLWVMTTSLALRAALPHALVGTALTGAWLVWASQPVMARGYVRIGEVGLLVLVTMLLAVLGRVARARRSHLADLRDLTVRLQQQQDALAQMAVAEERVRIAREVHDIVSHGVGSMTVLADGASRTALRDPARAVQAMERVRDTGREAMDELRGLLDVLREDEPGPRRPLPGMGDLTALIDGATEDGLPVVMTREGPSPRLTPGEELTVYRIVQESLTNIRKHGGEDVRRVDVRLRTEDDRLRIEVRDDGARWPIADEAGHGLRGMHERVALHGGTLEAGPGSAGGFSVRAALPIHEGPAGGGAA